MIKNEKKKILITGCGGMLGQAFYDVFKNDYDVTATDIDLNEDWLKYLDVRDYIKYLEFANKTRPDYIFHLAALTDLEYCEINQEETYRTNTMAVENAVSIANKLDATLLYISTAGIFDGEKEYYDDYDIPNPLSVYGRGKYMGERYVVENAQKYFVCRAGWMMGGGKKDKKFVSKIIKQIESGSKKIYAVSDKGGTPTYTFDFANTAKKLITADFYGVYNMVCYGDCSRYDVAEEMLRIMGLSDEIELLEVESSYFNKEYFARRPVSEKLLTSKLSLRELSQMGEWKISLKKYLESDFDHLINK